MDVYYFPFPMKVDRSTTSSFHQNIAGELSMTICRIRKPWMTEHIYIYVCKKREEEEP